MISDQAYLNWQKKLSGHVVFRRFWTFWGIYCIGFFYLGIIFFFLPQWQQMAALALIAFLLTKGVVLEVVYFIYKKQRPYQRLNFSSPISKLFISWTHNRLNSMPSGHAASLAAISIVSYIFFPILGWLGFVLTLLNGMGRVILGYHDVWDVLAGWALGILTGLATVYFLSPLLFK